MHEAYPWQTAFWQKLAARQQHPHAYLLHGAAGRQKVLAVQCADEHALQQARLRLLQLCHGAPGSST